MVATEVSATSTTIADLYLRAHALTSMQARDIAGYMNLISRELYGMTPTDRLMIAAMFIMAEMNTSPDELREN